jgi:adenylate kinase
MKIMIMGAPGSGKGTYSRGLSETLKLPLISTGDILRSLRSDPKVGSIIKEYQDKGLPVPDDIVIPLIQERLSKSDCRGGFIMDGDVIYNINQAKMIEKITDFDIVINLVLPDSILIKKNLGRRNCKKCGITFNVADINEQGIRMPALPPKKEGICDKCGGPLFIRTDDTEEVIRERLRIYWERIKPVMKFYNDKGLVRDVKVDASPDIMVPKILEVIKKELGVKNV